MGDAQFMKLSHKAQYACLAMLELAAKYHDPLPLSVKVIAEAYQLQPRFLVQILLQLKAAGLVASIRGAAGGYQLARAPGQITVADVINAIDPEQPVRKLVGSPGSPVVQAIHSVYREIHAEEQRHLRHLSLAELVRRAREGNAVSYQI
jgi:Rrf2 family protein